MSAEWLTVINNIVVSDMTDSCHDNTRQDNNVNLIVILSISIVINTSAKCQAAYTSVKYQAAYFVTSALSKEKAYVSITTSKDSAIVVKIDKNDVN